MTDIFQSDTPEEQNTVRIAWRKSRFGLVIIGLFTIFINIFRLSVPIYILQILDRVLGSRSVETLVMLASITMIAVVFSILLEVIRRRMLIAWSNWIERFLGPSLFMAGLQKSGKQKTKISEILRDIRLVRSFIASTGFVAWIDVTWAPIFIGIVFLISPPLSYILFGACLIALILGAISERIARSSREASHIARKDDQDWISMAERHYETVSSLNVVRNFIKQWCSNTLTRLDEGMRAQTIHIYFVAAIRLVGRFLRISILGFGVWLVIEQDLTIGALIAASVLSRTAFSMVQGAMVKWRDMFIAKKAYGRMKDSLKDDNSTQVSIPKSKAPAPLIIEKVSYRYPSQANSIFRGIDLSVNPGEVLFVIGHSAVGKTTFARLVSGLFAPRSGSIRLGYVNVFQLQQNSLIHGIGTMPQDTTLFKGSVRENIASMSMGNIDEVIRAAKLAGIHDIILTLPKGYDTIIGEYEPLLSSGQRKAIALARAFYGRPALVVLDEPIPHLDKIARSALFNAIKQLKSEGTIIVLTTQSKVPSKYTDKVVLLNTNQKHQILSTAEEVEALRNSSRGQRKYDKKEKNKKT